MKLVDKFTLWFIAVFILITPVSMFISFSNIKKNIDDAEISHLHSIHNRVAANLRAGVFGKPQGDVKAEIWTGVVPAKKMTVAESANYNSSTKLTERYFTLSSFYDIKNQTYRISSSSYVPRSDQIIGGMLKAIFWKILMVALCVAITARLISRYILSSFSHTLKSVRDFDLKSAGKINLRKTSIKEFRELNGFLESMTSKAVEDFIAVKEFSENASHELQTPLAVIRSKLELLTETDIREDQARFIGDMQNAVEKLSKINSSLVLLTRLENQEYKTDEWVDFGQITLDLVEIYRDRAQLKSLDVVSAVKPGFWMQIHPALADMLLNNLLGNAIRHNNRNGKIKITLSDASFTIENSGSPPESPTAELFQRFKKGNQCTDSVGLGLAIVKQICDLNGFAIRYDYASRWHTVTVSFEKRHVKRAIPASPGFASLQQV